MPASGGPATTITTTEPVLGASWGANNVIVFAAGGASCAPRDAVSLVIQCLWQVSADGGARQQLTTVDRNAGELSHRFPQVLPGGHAVVFTVVKTTGAEIAVRSLVRNEQRTLIEDGTDPQYVSSGHLAFVTRDGTLKAVPFDAARGEVNGAAVGVVNDVMLAINAPSAPLRTAAAQFSVSATGALIYVPGGVYPDPLRTLLWVDRQGLTQQLPTPPKAYLGPRLSPDEQRVALFTQRDNNIWIYDIARGSMTRFETTAGMTSQSTARPIWTPDGKRLTLQRLSVAWFGNRLMEALRRSNSRLRPVTHFQSRGHPTERS
jgi:serine/threonine-protein kinase